ncbi:lytic transglycosylase domain-containing protein (plasmid) [Burkholderia pyrrocinia]|uniref:lytic transglycosylase domain-containing protein n=1 Tax=Burkholderia pyrrocinia TaxID=60550 RepID=UPI0038B4FEC8
MNVTWLIVACVGDQARADCISDAAQLYNVNPDILRAIAYYESHLNPDALNRDANGTLDIGLMQINSVHLPTLRREGIGLAQLKDPAVNARVGAALLRNEINRYGATWRAVGAYHSLTPSLNYQYAAAVQRVFAERPWLHGCRSVPVPSVASDGVDVTSLPRE